jgi:hypothetical protein
LPQTGDFNRYLCIAVDITRYSAHDAHGQKELQRQLKEILESSATAAGLDRMSWMTQPQGDGELALVPVGPDEPRVIDDFIRHLDSWLERHNRERLPASRMRLRVAMHTGVALPAAMGFAGPAVVVVSRLLNSADVRRALTEAESANLALIASSTAFEIVELGQTTLRPSWFRGVAVVEKEYAGEAWIWIPNAERGDAATSPAALSTTGQPHTGAGPGQARALVGSIPRRAAHFQHRAKQLTEPAPEPAQASIKVIVGTGGVGKTQLAAAYAREAWQDGSADLVIWADASSRAGIITAYIQAATTLGVGTAEDGERAADNLVAYLATTDRRWLLVLDDVRLPRDADRWWPPVHRSGTMILTTRRRDAALMHLGDIVPVGPFDAGQSVAYLREWLGGQPAMLDGAEDLVDDLGHLPLALAQAAAYMTDRHLTCRQYQDRFRDQRRRLDQIVPESDSLPDGHQVTVATTWSLSIDAADQLPPVGLASRSLHIAAVLDPSGIPLPAFTASPALRYLGEGGPPLAATPTSAEAADALANLHRLNLADLSDDRLRVHALVQRAVVDRLSPAGLAAAVRAAADALREAWPAIERDQTHTDILRRNAAALTARFPDLLWADGAHPVIFAGVDSYGHVGLFQSAAEAYARIVPEAQRRLGLDHPDTLIARSRLARWRGEAGDPSGAAAALAVLFADCVRLFGLDHPETLAAWHSNAYWRGRAGDTKGAAVAFEALLAHRLRGRPSDRLEILETRSSLARWRGTSGDPLGAVEAYTSLLADRLEVLGPDHLETLNTRHGLAYWRGEAGDPAGAAAAFRDLLADRERLLGTDNRDALHTRSNLARWQGDAGDAAAAVAGFESLLADSIRLLGPEHPDTLNARHSLAYWRGAAGDPSAAAAEFEALLADYQRLFGADHRNVLDIRGNLAHWRGAAGDAAGAVAALGELVVDCLAEFGPDHLDTLMARYSLAYWRGAAGDPAGAAAAFAAVLEDRMRLLAPGHRDILRTRCNLARWRGEAGDVAEAAQALETLLEDCLTLLAAEHPQTVEVHSLLKRFRTEAAERAAHGEPQAHAAQGQAQAQVPAQPQAPRDRVRRPLWRHDCGRTADGTQIRTAEGPTDVDPTEPTRR